MLHYLVIWLFSAMAVLATSKIVSGFRVKSFGSALAAAIMIGLVNMILYPILQILSLPLTFLTMGLFYFVVNGALIKIAAAFIAGFEVDSWFSAIMGSIVLSLFKLGLEHLLH